MFRAEAAFNALTTGGAVVLALAGALVSPLFLQQAGLGRAQPSKLAPYVSSPQPVVERMLLLADVKVGDTVYDLGAGDGRIVMSAARRFGANAVGVELSETLVKRANQMIKEQGLEQLASVRQGDLLSVDVSPASVVTMYLMTEANKQIRPKLEKELRPGTRVVSLDFEIKGWKPAKVEKLVAFHRSYTLYLYEVPAHR